MDADPNKQALDAKQTIIFNLIFFCGLCSIQSARLLTLKVLIEIAVTSFLVYTLRMWQLRSWDAIADQSQFF